MIFCEMADGIDLAFFCWGDVLISMREMFLFFMPDIFKQILKDPTISNDI